MPKTNYNSDDGEEKGKTTNLIFNDKFKHTQKHMKAYMKTEKKRLVLSEFPQWGQFTCMLAVDMVKQLPPPPSLLSISLPRTD